MHELQLGRWYLLPSGQLAQVVYALAPGQIQPQDTGERTQRWILLTYTPSQELDSYIEVFSDGLVSVTGEGWSSWSLADLREAEPAEIAPEGAAHADRLPYEEVT